MRRAGWLMGLAIAALGAMVAHAQLPSVPEGTAPAPAWAPPSLEEVDQAIESAKAESTAQAIGETGIAPALAAEFDRLIAILGRQRVLVEEAAGADVAPASTDALPVDGGLDIGRIDALRTDVAAAERRALAARQRQSDARQAIEEAVARLKEAQRAVRAANEDAASNADALRVAELRERVAKADLEAIRLEGYVADAEVAAALREVETLTAALSGAAGRAEVSKKDLEERLAAIERMKQDLDARLVRAQGNLDFASDRVLAARRRADESGPDAVGATEEVAARTLWRDAYRREVDLLGRALERIGIEREIWEIRFRLAGDAAYRRSGEATARLLEVRDEQDRTRRLLESRLEEARSQAAKLADQARGFTGDSPEEQARVRWLKESGGAMEHLTDVLAQAERRLEGWVQLTDFALADAREADNARSVGDRLAAVWRWARGSWNAELFVVEERSITTGKLVVGISLLLAGLWIARLVARLIGRVVLRRIGLNEGAAAAAQAIIFYALLVTIALFALRLINIPLTVFTVLGGALAIGIGFGSQNLMNNFISGLIILAERPIRVGDLIQVGELHGIVQHIGARSTRVLTPNNIDIIVPNSSFLETNVTNWTLTEDRIRTQVVVGVAYGSPTREVIRLMKKAAEDHGKVLDKPPPAVLFTEFGDNALMFELTFWLRMRRMMDRRAVESDLRLRINELFREAGICIAFPQRDVHIDGLGPIDVRMVRHQESDETSDREARQ